MGAGGFEFGGGWCTTHGFCQVANLPPDISCLQLRRCALRASPPLFTLPCSCCLLPAVAKEAAPAKPAAKPAAKKLGLAKPAAKPAAAAGAAAPAASKPKAPASKPKAAKPAAAADGEGSGEPAAKAPKRACNAYFFFAQAKRAEVKGE